ncbi:MAG: type IX secretion system sortase PorU [Prolixibacteraceae bacterium]|nr:type IX secretion system sortase PorU [Prolixibacteraceae bacterium]
MKYFSILIILFICLPIYTIAQDTYIDQSVLDKGKWIKIATSQQGIHKITYSQLSSWGINNPENIAMFSNGGYILPEHNNTYYPDDLKQLNIIHDKDQNGDNCVFFYSTGTVKWQYNNNTLLFEHTQNLYTNNTYFFITSDFSKKSPAPNIKNLLNETPSDTINSYNNYKLYEKDVINIQQSGKIWYSDRIMRNTTKEVKFNFFEAADNNINLTVSGTASSKVKSWFNIQVNNATISPLELRTSAIDHAQPQSKTYSLKASDELAIKLTYQTEAGKSGDSWLDFIRINRISKLKHNNKQLQFRNIDSRNHHFIRFNLETAANNLILLDITDPLAPIEVQYNNHDGGIHFIDEGVELKEYIVFSPEETGIAQPTFIEEVKNQNIHGLPLSQMIIVTHPDFIIQSEKLATFHREHDQLKVLVIETPQIYNEFSSGSPDPTGIKNMLRMFYNRGKNTKNQLKYALLMGDGSYNNNESLTSDKLSFVPTYQSLFMNHGETITSDDYFALLDESEGSLNGYIDIGIGRIPCSTQNEAEIAVDKTINYTLPENMGNWRNVISFWADDEDGNRHMIDTESLIDVVKDNYTGFYIDKIYFDSFNQISSSGGDQYPNATEAINRRVNEGALILNYVGHADNTSIAHEDVLVKSDIRTWNNQNKLPVFVTATCEFSRFDHSTFSAGEEILFSPYGGGVALFSTTRLVYSGSNFRLSKSFYSNVFKQDSTGQNLRMGDIMRLAKNQTQYDGGNKRSFALLGDPALRLAFPKYKVQTKSINGIENSDSIRIGAMDKVTIEGEVTDNTGKLLTNYNGTTAITIYDKSLETQTLANDGGNAFKFDVQNNIIYKGTVSVKNGEFSFSFVVPKDIAYNIDNGEIYYYTYNDTIDGHGACDKIVIGGSGENPVVDNTPPQIDLFMNNEDFEPYGQVSTNALLIAKLFDESGINTAGTGIGHDITAVIDNDYSSQIVLNNFYQSALDTYQEGTIIYPLNNLEPGEHKITVKVWDVQNNSASTDIYFTVADDFTVTSVKNAPNPVRFHTDFIIEHNLPGKSFDVLLEIFSLNGQKIHESTQTASSAGTIENTIGWDISDSAHSIPDRSILIYRLTLANRDGLKATGTGKMIIKY